MEKYRGRPAGLWELLEGEKKVGITLQRLSEKLDTGEIVVYDEVSIEDDETFQDIQSKLYGHKSYSMLEEAIRKFNDKNFTTESLEEVGDLYTLPQKPSTVARYILKNTRRRLR